MQWIFSAPDTVGEVEEYQVELFDVTGLEFDHCAYNMRAERLRPRSKNLAPGAVFQLAVGAATRSLFGWGGTNRRRGRRRVYRNGLLRAGFVTVRHHPAAGARTREKSFLPVVWQPFQRRAEEVSLLIREAFCAGSAPQVGG